MQPKKITKIEKPWGHEEIIETNPHYTVKRLFMQKGHQCSYQYHEQKTETVVSLSGTLTVMHENGALQLNPGQAITIKPGEKHRMKATDEDCFYLEASTSQLDDVVRIEDDYGRN